MQSIIEEIKKLRNGKPMVIDYQNKNRYRLVLYETDGSKTAYYFSAPIYNLKSRKLVDIRFDSIGRDICATGSNTNIRISDNITLNNHDGSCLINLNQKAEYTSIREAQSGTDVIIPTINGIAMKCNIKNVLKTDFVIEVGESFLNVRANDKYFALMKEKFRPLVVFSCIGSLDQTGNVIAPAKIQYRKIADNKYQITIFATSPLSYYVMLECNLYENKLFQDTTVESLNPSTNNAFGGTGFIGNTALYGEQWLYSRLDYSRIPEIMGKRINKAILHMPKFNQSKVELCAFKVSARFCSFGSNWDNKISSSISISDSSCNNNYQSIDFTPLIIEERTRTIVKSEGMILKPKIKGNGFSVIATGDSYYAPQILEINYR